MPETRRPEERPVRSSDPSLSPHANALLTGEIRGIVGARIGFTLVAMTGVAVAAVVLLVWDTTAALLVALAALAATTAVVLVTTLRVAGEAEHPDPDTAALLEGEGVADPDRVLQDLVDEFTPDRRPA